MASASGGKSDPISGCDDSSASDSDSEDSGLISKGAAGGRLIAGVGNLDGSPGCKEHSGEPAIAFCETCDDSICCRCCVGSKPKHSSHTLVSLTEKFEKTSRSERPDGKASDTLRRAKAKQEKLKDLRQRVKVGHKTEIKAVKINERIVLANLRQKFDKEVETLEDTLDTQTRAVEKLSLDKIEAILRSSELQLNRVDEALKNVTTVIDNLRKPSAGKKQQDPDASAAEVIDIKSVDVVSGETKFDDFIPLYDFPAVVKVNDKDHTVPTTTTLSGKGSIASASRSVVLPEEGVTYLRSRIASLLPADVTECGKYKCNAGYVVITRDYHISCRQFAEGKTNVFPRPLQTPDPGKPYSFHDDVTYLPPDDASALCAVAGGKPTVTLGGGDCAWHCDGKIEFRFTTLQDEQGKDLKIPGRPEANAYMCNLPARETFHNSLQQYTGYYPSVLKEKRSENVIDSSLTVGAWRGGSIDLIVIK